eukprot:gnl/MRDRNA2_/MRDRNA2_84813_c0_seq1.p1 gnl/MRDRNA2_/MRDRNA2_84813_c0~~gnl/MRDRNA2_/MRDRNA2_84813_c0_seq1.p1  ORF type:complete len:503 (-),score=120.98 gnl/MRDRNA2_/MRDRNA2_84813_c0_seq1:22-1473(-)
MAARSYVCQNAIILESGCCDDCEGFVVPWKDVAWGAGHFTVEAGTNPVRLCVGPKPGASPQKDWLQIHELSNERPIKGKWVPLADRSLLSMAQTVFFKLVFRDPDTTVSQENDADYFDLVRMDSPQQCHSLGEGLACLVSRLKTTPPENKVVRPTILCVEVLRAFDTKIGPLKADSVQDRGFFGKSDEEGPHVELVLGSHVATSGTPNISYREDDADFCGFAAALRFEGQNELAIRLHNLVNEKVVFWAKGDLNLDMKIWDGGVREIQVALTQPRGKKESRGNLRLRYQLLLGPSDPSDVEGWCELGVCRMQKAKFDEAASAFSIGLTLCEDDGTGHGNSMKSHCIAGRAACHQQQHDFKALLKDADEILAVEPALLAALEWRLMANEGLEKFEDALDDARAILRSNPGHLVANRKQHELDRIVRNLNPVKKDQPEHPERCSQSQLTSGNTSIMVGSAVSEVAPEITPETTLAKQEEDQCRQS